MSSADDQVTPMAEDMARVYGEPSYMGPKEMQAALVAIGRLGLIVKRQEEIGGTGNGARG